ncbi:MAG: hypothetical protein RE471_09520 [Ferroplasma sp.]|uniref:hypothetical protein n=1 Tax=Ferroplasma sp. TaxID=2591003 RepID=UPI002814C99A|nr:hypothetical protein [Ferroplasma sp.]WMT51203.1 MAG: hypothetical protein RE471_09520 [Ferroplasma sp.]
MKKYLPAVIIVLSLVMVMAPFASSASPVTLPAAPSTLPSITYNYNGTNESITGSDWISFFSSVIDNTHYVKYSFNTSTQYLIVYDLSYTGMNPYGLQFIQALSGIGTPTLKNMTLAFNDTKGETSQVKGYTDIQALNAGAYPGFSFSKPAVKPISREYLDVGIIVAIIAGMVALYYVFNRKK